MDRLEAFLRAQLGAHPHDLEEHALRELGASPSDIRSALASLIAQGVVLERSRDGERELVWNPVFVGLVNPELQEDEVWRKHVAPRVADTAPNVQSLLHFGFTEMLNNVVDHSAAHDVVITVRRLQEEVEIYIEDNGVGIFDKLQREKGLEDPRHVALELSKGRLTTDPARHTGEGIFFTARMCDRFLIWSDSTVCSFGGDGAWQVMTQDSRPGTTIRMVVRLDTQRTPRDVFDEFAPPSQDLAFTKTSIHASLAQQAGDELVSRSQAKRLLARCEDFREIELDFKGIAAIGPAFADEVFRVFPSQHPGLVIQARNAEPDVLRMIERARRNAENPRT